LQKKCHLATGLLFIFIMKFNFKNSFFWVLIFFIGVGFGTIYERAESISLSGEIDLSLLQEAWGEINNNYYKFSSKDKEKMVHGTIQGLVDSLGDPYSDFLDPKETEKFEEGLNGIYEGIGAEIGIRNDNLLIISPFKGSPAQKAGILPRDRILEINKKSTEEMTLLDAVSKIRGKEGTQVNLKIKREKKILNVKITRSTIEIPALDFEILEGDIAYIQIYNFYEDAPKEFKQVINDKILTSNIKKIILDLRGNPGGFLSSASDIGNFFIKKGDVILKEDFGGNEINEILSDGPGSLSSFDVVILVDEGSASASEILAGAIKDQNKALIIGQKSFGKGTVQQPITLRDGSTLKITIARWLLPSGKSIEGKGITPDIKVKITKKDIEVENDPQLDRAVKEIRSTD